MIIKTKKIHNSHFKNIIYITVKPIKISSFIFKLNIDYAVTIYVSNIRHRFFTWCIFITSQSTQIYRMSESLAKHVDELNRTVQNGISMQSAVIQRLSKLGTVTTRPIGADIFSCLI